MQNMQKWNIEYGKGYFQALLDFREILSSQVMGTLKTKKHYKTALLSCLTLLLTDSYVRDIFMQTKTFPCNDMVDVKMKPDGTVFAEYKKQII